MIELRESIPRGLPAFIEMEKDADTSGYILPYSLAQHRSVEVTTTFGHSSELDCAQLTSRNESL